MNALFFCAFFYKDNVKLLLLRDDSNLRENLISEEMEKIHVLCTYCPIKRLLSGTIPELELVLVNT